VCACVYTGAPAWADAYDETEAFMHDQELLDLQDDLELRQMGLDRNSQRLDSLQRRIEMLEWQQFLNRSYR
jgi:hypothetical protein